MLPRSAADVNEHSTTARVVALSVNVTAMRLLAIPRRRALTLTAYFVDVASFLTVYHVVACYDNGVMCLRDVTRGS